MNQMMLLAETEMRSNHPKYADLCLPFKLSNFASKKQCSI